MPGAAYGRFHPTRLLRRQLSRRVPCVGQRSLSAMDERTVLVQGGASQGGRGAIRELACGGTTVDQTKTHEPARKPTKKAEFAWHRHPALIAGIPAVGAIIGSVLTIVLGQAGRASGQHQSGAATDHGAGGADPDSHQHRHADNHRDTERDSDRLPDHTTDVTDARATATRRLGDHHPDRHLGQDRTGRVPRRPRFPAPEPRCTTRPASTPAAAATRPGSSSAGPRSSRPVATRPAAEASPSVRIPSRFAGSIT